MGTIRSTLAALSVGMLVALALVAPANASPEVSNSKGETGAAAALACSRASWGDYDKTGSGYLKDGWQSELLRIGPYAECSGSNTVWDFELLYYHCYTTNSYGNTWTHVRIDPFQIWGWVWDGILDDGGSNVPC